MKFFYLYILCVFIILGVTYDLIVVSTELIRLRKISYQIQLILQLLHKLIKQMYSNTTNQNYNIGQRLADNQDPNLFHPNVPVTQLSGHHGVNALYHNGP